MNALMLLKTDHRMLETLFKQFEKLGAGKDKQKKQLVANIVRELAIHTQIEEQLFYPATRKAVPKAKEKVLESLEAHHIMAWTLSEISKMEPRDERFDAKLHVLIDTVRRHVKEEENELFPLVRARLDAKALKLLGDAMQKAKKIVPTRPHPRAPIGPGSLITALPIAVLDRARDVGKKLAKTITGRGAPKHNGHAASARRGRAGSHAPARQHH